MSQNGLTRFRSSLLAFAAGTMALTVASIAEAAPIQQGTNIEEGKCETVSVGQYFCKINGKCYYCDTKTNPDPNKNCYKETTCTAVMTNPALRRPFGGRAPIMRRGVEGDTPASEDNQEPSTPPTSK